MGQKGDNSLEEPEIKLERSVQAVQVFGNHKPCRSSDTSLTKKGKVGTPKGKRAVDGSPRYDFRSEPSRIKADF